MSSLKKLTTYWKRHRVNVLAILLAPTAVIILLLGLPTWPIGLEFSLILTIPCSTKVINENKILWGIRQLYFLSISLVLAFPKLIFPFLASLFNG